MNAEGQIAFMELRGQMMMWIFNFLYFTSLIYECFDTNTNEIFLRCARANEEK